MADLQLCYFCGSGPDSSLGEYAVVPPALEPTDDQQVSVVLCPDCREKLTAVMDPVVAAAEAHAGVDDGPSAREGPSPPDAGKPAGDESTGDGVGSPAPGGPRPGPGATDDDGADAPDGPTRPADEDVEPDDAPTEPPARPEPADDDGRPTADDDPPSDSNAKRDQPHADDELVGRNNEAYNKTLRLLQNREFPVERHEIEQVAANAYQLDPQEVSDAIDALIRKGLLSQEGAQLVRP